MLALQELVVERVLGVLPALWTLFLEEPLPWGPVKEAIRQLVAARELANHPIFRFSLGKKVVCSDNGDGSEVWEYEVEVRGGSAACAVRLGTEPDWRSAHVRVRVFRLYLW